jgi:hypothetical protein
VRSGFEFPPGYAIFGSDLGVSRSRRKVRQNEPEYGTTISRPGAPSTEKDQESLGPKGKMPGESGTEKDQERLKPKEKM